MTDKRNNALQALCRDYLGRLRDVAKEHGLLPQLNGLIEMNRRKECEATEHECEMLSRLCDDERIKRTDVPKILGKSYRRCFEDGDFDNPNLKKLRPVGIYSKVSALLFKAKKDGDKRLGTLLL